MAALKTLFASIPADTGLAYVVVVHLSPEHKSHLPELLQPHVNMPVLQVSDTMPLEPNRVYVIPPGANLDTIDTHLRLTELEQRRQERARRRGATQVACLAKDNVAGLWVGIAADQAKGCDAPWQVVVSQHDERLPAVALKHPPLTGSRSTTVATAAIVILTPTSGKCPREEEVVQLLAIAQSQEGPNAGKPVGIPNQASRAQASKQ